MYTRFPPHCTHALQPFEVDIAKKLKRTYTKDKIKISAPERREIAVDCIITAWNMTLCYKSASEVFRKTGLYPFDAGMILYQIKIRRKRLEKQKIDFS